MHHYLIYSFYAVISIAKVCSPNRNGHLDSNSGEKRENEHFAMQIFLRVLWTNHRNFEMIYLTAFCDNTIAATLSWMHSNHSNKWPAILYSLVFCVNGNCIRCDNMRIRKVRTKDKVTGTNFVPKSFSSSIYKECILALEIDNARVWVLDSFRENRWKFFVAMQAILFTTVDSAKAELQIDDVFSGKVFSVLRLNRTKWMNKF